MADFIGAEVAEGRNQTAFIDLFEFNVSAPISPDFDPLAVLPAFVTPEVEQSHVAEGLARAFGAASQGDVIEVNVQEVLFDGTIRRFALPIVVAFASKNRGSDYIQIGIADLDEYFNIRVIQSANERWIELSLRPDSDRECTEEPEVQ